MITMSGPGIAILGAGIFIKEAHLPALAKSNANILAIYSRSKSSASSVKAEAGKLGFDESQISIYSDDSEQGLDALLKRDDIKGCIVALPILIQPDVARKCLAAGKHVLIEKPIAKDVAGAEQLIQDYERTYAPKGLILSVAEQFRYDAAFDRAREIVSEGTIGEITAVHGRVWGNIKPDGTNKYYETEWRKNPAYQDGFILDGGVHFVALMRHVSGLEITDTTSFARQLYEHLPPVDTVNAALKFGNGALGSLSISFASARGAFEYIFIGRKGSLEIGGGKDGTTIEVKDEEGKVVLDGVVEGKGVEREDAAFIEALKSGKAGERAGAREALNDVAVVESICSGGGKVKLYKA